MVGTGVVVGGLGTGGRRVNSDRRSIGPPLGGGVGSTEGFIQSATRGRRDRQGFIGIKPHPGRADRDSPGTNAEHTTRHHSRKYKTNKKKKILTRQVAIR